MNTNVLVLAASGTEAFWRSFVGRLGYAVEVVGSPRAAISRLEGGRGDETSVVVIADPTALENGSTVTDISKAAPEASIILSLRDLSRGTTITELHPDCRIDILPYPPAEDALKNALQAAAHRQCSTVESEKPAPWVNPKLAPAFVGQSPAMRAIASVLRQIGSAEVPVLIQGETGSGKEVIAREVHANSRRATKPFFKLNCAALPSELVESELFGYERGAFTGAVQRKAGIFELADGGTLLLDEIGDMDVRLQSKLLQVLQDHSFQRIGGKGLVTVDVRVIAATHRDLEKNIEAGTFREDLYYRLNVVNIVVPPLRERKQDLLPLTELLLKKHATPGESIPAITPELLDVMAEWHWPGNVRELENFARRLLIFRNCESMAHDLKLRTERFRSTRTRHVTPIDLPVRISEPARPTAPQAGFSAEPVRALELVTAESRRAEADTIIAALNSTRWNRRKTAVLLNIDYKALLYRMKKLGIEPEDRCAAEPQSFEAAPVAAMCM